MEFRIAETDAEREQARILINKIFSKYQRILKDGHELIPLEYRETILAGENKELIILCINNKVVGTALIEIGPDSAYTIYLARDESLQGKDCGKDLMNFAENRAKKIYSKNKMRVSIIYHPKYDQERLEKWYTKELDYHFLLRIPANSEQQQAWKPDFQDAKFKYFEKNLAFNPDGQQE